ncbi:MAG: FmdB family zinc ribbon protein [Planctomycetota bacterium]
MPIYEYKCTECEHVTEVLERPGKPSRPTCRQCGSRRLEKVFSAFGLGKRGTSSGGACRTPT